MKPRVNLRWKPNPKYGRPATSPIDTTTKRRRELAKRFGWRCWYCDIKLEVDGGHLDHIFPKSRGGSDAGTNWALTCSFCNRAKYDHLLEEFMSWIEYVRSGGSFTPYDISPAAVDDAEYARKLGKS